MPGFRDASLSSSLRSDLSRGSSTSSACLPPRRLGARASDLTLGSLRVETPVVLAPMAGITNAAYRRLCAEQGAGLYVCEMITSRGLVEGDETTRQMLVFDEAEQVRSVQLYGTDPVYVGKAVEILCSEYGVAHVDLNFGCPVPKVTRKGGGGALPWKRGLLGQILEHAADPALLQFDRLADPRLGDAQALGRTPEVKLFGERQEDFDVAQLHRGAASPVSG